MKVFYDLKHLNMEHHEFSKDELKNHELLMNKMQDYTAQPNTAVINTETKDSTAVVQKKPETNQLCNLSLALGFFDGVHIGHRAVINNAVLIAKSNNTKSAVITFEVNPKFILNNSKINTTNNAVLKQNSIELSCFTTFTEPTSSILNKNDINKIYYNNTVLQFKSNDIITTEYVLNNNSTNVGLYHKINNNKKESVSQEPKQSTFIPQNITPIINNETKIKLIQQLGIDYIFFLDFNKYRYLLAIDFLQLLIEYFAPIAITTGFNYYFGYKKSGNTELLTNMSNEYNYKYFEIGAVKYNNTVVSSTLIRELIKKEEWNIVNLLLGYEYYAF